MATLAERSLGISAPGSGGGSSEPGGWGLLLIPVLLCIGMLIFALATTALPAPTEVPVSRSCGSSYEPRVADC